MHRLRIGFCVVLLLGLAPAVNAELGGAPPPDAQTSAAAQASAEPETPFGVALRERNSVLLRETKSDVERGTLERISGVYAARRYAPLWAAGGAFSPKAEAAIAEIRRAGDWGLDPAAFDLPRLAPGATPDAIAAADLQLSRAVVKYAAHARGARVDPSQLSLWLDQRPRAVDVEALLPALAEAAAPDAALRRLHPQHPGFERLREAYLALRDPGEKPRDVVPDGPRIFPGETHPHVAAVRRKLGVASPAEGAELYDDELAARLRSFMRQTTGRGQRKDVAIDDKVRALLNKPSKDERDAAPTRQKILVNMERWRYLADDLGAFHIWNNLPEFETRVVRDGEVIHQERLVIGKPNTQTPVFSDKMEFVVFNPDWGVPNSIKIKDLLPSLAAGNDSILDRYDMKIVANGKVTHASRIDWGRTDIREVAIVQNPGPSNPLGQLKFMFPNRHDVYMHDTPSKNLFASNVRTFSHGCIRVRNPRRLAEVIFAKDRNWTARDVSARLQSRIENNRIELTQPIPVHNVYFTLVADEKGGLKSLPDVYGHDKRVGDALDGKSLEQIAAADPARRLAKEIAGLAQSGGTSGRVAVRRPPPVRYAAEDPYGWGPPTYGRPPQRRSSGYGYVPPPRFFPFFFGN
jgi:murein L,D-transpeptidase YcbB/YkuD